jgi:hypothetical protein
VDGSLSSEGDPLLTLGGLRDGERDDGDRDEDALLRFNGGDLLLGPSPDLGRPPPRRDGGERERELSRLGGRFPRGPVGAFGGGGIKGRREGGGGIGASWGAGRPLPPPLAASSARRLRRSFSFHSAC